MKMISNIMDFNTLRIYGMNTAAIAATFTGLDEAVKLILLLATLVFTIVKTMDIVRGWRKKKQDE